MKTSFGVRCIRWKTAVTVAIALVSAANAPRASEAQLNGQPVITSLQTIYGAKNGVPAATANMPFTIKGTNFSSIPTNVTVRIERNVNTGGTWSWVLASQTNPTNASVTTLTANVGNFVAGDYRVFVYVRNRGWSNFKNLVIVPSNSYLNQSIPSQALPETAVALRGNLLPRIDARVVMTPPAEIAPYQAVREITPTAIGAFETTFVLPNDVWEGIWKVRIVGWDGGTNDIPFKVLKGAAAVYSVRVDGYKCFDETADGPGDDEPYLSTITYVPGDENFFKLGVNGSYVTQGVMAGTWRGGLDLNYWYQDGQLGTQSNYITDPTKPHYIIGLAECDQFYLTGGFVQVWDHNWNRYEYGERMAGLTIDAAIAARNNNNSTLNSGNPSYIADWFKASHYSVLQNGDDECIGVKVVRWTKDDVYKARSLNGQPLTKTLVMTGDSSRYEVYVTLTKIGGL